jgi:DNA-directed RNA polymerase specialized sigma24 family protein
MGRLAMAVMQETPITSWLAQLKAGNPDAVQPLWERYYSALVSVARQRLPKDGCFDSHVVAASAFDSFFQRAMAGKFPKLDDRHDLWRILFTITARKACDAIEKRESGKRGGGWKKLNADTLDLLAGTEPTPEFVFMMIEQLNSLLDQLGDDQLRQIAVWKMEGETNQEIADRLACALRTVSNKLNLIRAIFSRGGKK